ncbi:MAG: GNAT family N-acetyltransferase, partial [Bacteroidota bacterium]
MSDDTAFRPAERADAAVLAELVNYAGEGIPLYLWEQMKELGETAWDAGRRRAARDEGAFSYRNAVVIECEGEAAGALIGYGIADEPEAIPDDFPAMFRPLQELENLAPGTWYVNVLAVLPAFRNRGLGRRLLERAEEAGRTERRRGMSLIVADANAGAVRLYQR